VPSNHEHRKKERHRQILPRVSRVNPDTTGVEIMVLVWNRAEFTRKTMQCLRDNTNWKLVSKLVIYDDGSEDGADSIAVEHGRAIPVQSFEFRPDQRFRAPAAYMNDFLATCEAPLFVKIDNDIAVPPGWLDVMYDVMSRNPTTELLGMEYGQSLPPSEEWDGKYQAMPCRHIGGVGMMRTQGFFERPPLMSRGRNGWTEHQHRYKPRRAWVTPDLPVVQLDRLPHDPWRSLSEQYIANGWQRDWGAYAADDMFWEWMR